MNKAQATATLAQATAALQTVSVDLDKYALSSGGYVLKAYFEIKLEDGGYGPGVATCDSADGAIKFITKIRDHAQAEWQD